MKISPYSQGNENFDLKAKLRADNIFSKYDFYNEVFCNNEIIFSNFKHFVKKYRRKKILIIGGGPSTKGMLEKDYESIFSKYDYLWSSNSFFLNSKLKNIKIDLAMMMLEPNLKSVEFQKYYEKFKPVIGFELHNKWKNYRPAFDEMFMMQTRFYGIIGVCQRMIIFASFIGADTIGFVGLDGLKSMKAGDHSFEKNKKSLPSITNEDTFQYQSDVFWDYINDRYKKPKIVNHGNDVSYHRNLKKRV